MPTTAEVLAQLDALIRSRYSKAAREAANSWATPLLIENDEATIATEPAAVGPALYLLGAADLLAQLPDTYLYQEVDFVRARTDLAEESGHSSLP